MDSVGLARIAIACAVFSALAATDVSTRAAEPSPPIRVELWADRDDDDADGRPDGEQTALTLPTHVDLVPIGGRLAGAAMEVISGGEHARVVSTLGKPLAWGRVLPAAGWVQGLSPGRVELVVQVGGAGVRLVIEVRGIASRDEEGRLADTGRSH